MMNSMLSFYYLHLILLLICLLQLNLINSLNFNEAKENIRDYLNHLKENKQNDILINAKSSCTITENESCSINNLPIDQTTLVYPGGNTRCIYSYSTPFSFQVIPGDRDKLIFSLQGGGACWDEVSVKLGLCTSDAIPQALVGIYDRTNEMNAFKSYTIVNVLYCSGDVHGGNTTRSYSDDAGIPIEQKGLYNAQAALDYIVQQVNAKQLDSSFTDLVIIGQSAGSVGAQLWGHKVLSTLTYTKASVLPDSYAGVFPKGSEGPLMYDFGFCTSGFLSKKLENKCLQQNLTLLEMNIEFMKLTPKVPYAFIQSKTDIVQRSFYTAIAATGSWDDVYFATPSGFYNRVNEIFSTYNSLAKNFITYLVDGSHHTYTGEDLYYTADSISSRDNGTSTNQVMMYDWVGSFPLSISESITSICEGPVKKNLGMITINDNNTTFCSTNVIPKTFTQV